MNLAVALNRKYVPYTIVMLTSFCENNREEHNDIYLLHTRLNEEDITVIRDALARYDVTIRPLHVPAERIEGVVPHPEVRAWTIEIYNRLFLSELLPETVDRIFYFDVDIIVNKSLSEIYHADLMDKDLWVVEDCEAEYFTGQMNKKLQEIGAPLLPDDYRYFNSGMLLLNMERVRKYTFADYLEAIKKWEYAMTAPDQDILNYLHGKNAGYLPGDRYNLFARFAHLHGITYDEVREQVAVIHFTGDKPWRTSALHFDIEQLWWDYAKLVPHEIYHALLEDFQVSTVNDPELEQTVQKLVDDNNRMVELSQKLLERFQGA